MLNDLLKIDSLENFKNFIRNTFNNFNDISYLKYYIILRKYEFSQELLDRNRLVLEYPIVEHVNKMNMNKHNKLKEKIGLAIDECYEEWPICIYDSDSVYKVHNYFVLKDGLSPSFVEDYFDLKFKEKKNSKKICLQKVNFDNALIERKIHLCVCDKRRKKPKKTITISTILEQINDQDDSLNLSTGTTGDKSLDISMDKFIAEQEDFNSANSLSTSDKKIRTNSKHEAIKRNYKKFKKQTKFLSLVSYSQFVKAHREENDFQSFISKLNNKWGKSLCLKNMDFDFKSNYSRDKSFDL